MPCVYLPGPAPAVTVANSSEGQFWGQKGRGPPKKPQEMPHYMFCPRQNNNFQDFLNQRWLVFLCPKEREREREKEREREERRETRETREKREKREKRDERQESRDERRESRDESRETRDERSRDVRRAGDYIAKPPGPKWKKSANFTGSGIVCTIFNSPKGELITYYPAEFKIARENRYVWKICMILVSVVCRPAGHKTDFAMIFQFDAHLTDFVPVFVLAQIFHSHCKFRSSVP